MHAHACGLLSHALLSGKGCMMRWLPWRFHTPRFCPQPQKCPFTQILLPDFSKCPFHPSPRINLFNATETFPAAFLGSDDVGFKHALKVSILPVVLTSEQRGCREDHGLWRQTELGSNHCFTIYKCCDLGQIILTPFWTFKTSSPRGRLILPAPSLC